MIYFLGIDCLEMKIKFEFSKFKESIKIMIQKLKLLCKIYHFTD